MDLGSSSTSSIGRYDGRSVAELLTEIRAEMKGRQASQIREWVAITAWADQNVVTTVEGAATLVEGVIDTGVPIAGPGAPLVSEFNLMELIATLARTPDGGRAYVGRVIECAWRLHGVYAAVLDGRIPPWKAERIADLTRALNSEAAAFVDRHLSAVRDPGWAQIERLVREAVIRFDPERAEADRQAAADHRHFDLSEVDEHGLVHVGGLMDAADGHDLDRAVTRRAVLRGRLGDESSMDVRRSIAAAELARQDLALDLLTADEETGEVTATVPGRKVVLNVHVTDTALAQLQHHGPGSRDAVGRWEEGNSPVATTQIKEWLQAPHTTVIVRPVIDLADCVPVDSYEIPDRLHHRVQLRDHTCRFPGCSVRATRCDLDHSTRTATADRPALATSSPSVDDITEPRPTADGATRPSNQPTTSGPAPTTDGSSSHPAAPTPSTPDAHRQRVSSASLPARRAKLAANAFRMRSSTRGLESTWLRTAAAHTP